MVLGFLKGDGKGGCGDPRPCLLLHSVLMAMEKEEEGGSPSSSEEEEEEEEGEEDVALNSDMEEVSGRNLAIYSAQARTQPLNTPHPATGETCSWLPSRSPALGRLPQPDLLSLTRHLFYQNTPRFQPRFFLASSKQSFPNPYPPRGQALPLTGLTLPQALLTLAKKSGTMDKYPTWRRTLLRHAKVEQKKRFCKAQVRFRGCQKFQRSCETGDRSNSSAPFLNNPKTPGPLVLNPSGHPAATKRD